MEPTEAINTIPSMAHTVNTEGPISTIIAVFIVVFIISQFIMYRQTLSYRKNQDETMHSFMQCFLDQNNKITDFLMGKESKNEKETKNDLMETFLSLNKKMKEDLKDAIDVLDSDRVAIYVFHNGTRTPHGLPFFKFSCICEEIARASGSRSKMKEHSNIPLSLLDDVINTLWKNGHYEYFAKSHEVDNNFINRLLLQDDNKTCLFYTIYDIDNNIIGFILSEFNEDSFTREQIKEKHKYLHYISDKVTPILLMRAKINM